ncbi:MAG TPA: site-2 protease family protein, partial [Solirubrobacteraceae bacterium]|nr:site-2 protease family protein [Solirubrobacteraceae bacterium]
MGGGRSIQLARVFGVRIGVDASWFVVLFLVILLLSSQYKDVYPGQDTKAYVLAAASALLFFASVVLHELGHAVVAIRNGIGIDGIDLWMFGGVARMKGETKTPGQEFRVAIAGPIVTAVVAAVCWLAGGRHVGIDGSHVSSGTTILRFLTIINVAVLVFNLVPGIPLDGGRIARAIAWWRTGDRDRATRFAARIGRGFGLFLVGVGIFLLLGPARDTFNGVWLIAVGFMLSQTARATEVQSRISERFAGLRVADVMDNEPVVLPAQTKLDRALDEFFLRYRWPWFPVVDATGRFLGLVSRQKIEDVPEALRPGSSVDQVMTIEDAGSYRIGLDEPLESLLRSEGLARLGALMAVDPDGVVRGIVTVDRVRRALRTPTAIP